MGVLQRINYCYRVNIFLSVRPLSQFCIQGSKFLLDYKIVFVENGVVLAHMSTYGL